MIIYSYGILEHKMFSVGVTEQKNVSSLEATEKAICFVLLPSRNKSRYLSVLFKLFFLIV